MGMGEPLANYDAGRAGHPHYNGPQRTDVLTPAGDPFDRRACPADAATWEWKHP